MVLHYNGGSYTKPLRRNHMDDTKIITAYVIIDDVLKHLGHKSHCLAQVSDAEVLTVAVVALWPRCTFKIIMRYEITLTMMHRLGYLGKPLSTSRFSRRLHALSHWLEYVTELVGMMFAQGEAYIIDSLPVPVCRRARARRCHGAAKCGDAHIVDTARLRRSASSAGACT